MTTRDPLLTRLKETAVARKVGKRLVAELHAREAGRPRPRPRSSVWALEKLALFSKLSGEDRDELERRATTRTLKKREVALLDDDADAVWLVDGGGIKLCRVSLFGGRMVEAILSPGDVFGRLTAAPDATPYELGALEPSRILAFPRALFVEVLKRHPDMSYEVVQTLEARQRRLVRRIESLVFKDVRARLAETLLELANDQGSPCEHGFAVDVRITQQDLAELVGASRQMVNRVLGELSRKLYVHKNGRLICVLSKERLARLAAEPKNDAELSNR